MNRFLRAVAELFSQPQTQRSTNAAWLDEEEQKQMQELRDRLECVQQQLWEFDRRKAERGPT